MLTCPHCGSTPATTLIVGVRVPIKLESEPNRRDHFFTKAARAAKHRQTWATVALLISEEEKKAVLDALKSGVLLVNIVRVEPRILDSDNAVAAAKATRDEVSRWLGINDASTAVKWLVTQERPGVPGARVEFRRLER